MVKKTNNSSPFSSNFEKSNLRKLNKIFKSNILGDNTINELTLFLKRQNIMRILFLDEIYKQIKKIDGHIFEFGCKWGTNLSIYTNLRGIYEPYNHNRKVIAFDTFEGIKGTSKKDGASIAGDGSYSTKKGHEIKLDELLSILESFCPIPHINKHELIKGDVRKTLLPFLKKNKQIIASLIYLDMDLYAPTKYVLKKILPYTTKGTVIVFDESNWSAFPGPTIALDEIIGKKKYKINKSKYQPIPSYIVLQ